MSSPRSAPVDGTDSVAGVYRFALRPFWLASHLFVVVLVIVMANLGLWQLQRLDDRRAFNDTVRASLAEGPRALGASAPEPWDRLVVRGTFRQGADVLVGNRSNNGQPGFWVLTPLDTPVGALTVNRGFVARALVQQEGLASTVAPRDEVEFVGVAQASRSGVLATTSGLAGATEVSQVDVEVLAAHWQGELLPFWVQATAAQGERLQAVGDPTLDDGPHLGYAMQWFVFTAIAAGGYGLILRRNARAVAIGQHPDVTD